VLVFGCGVKKGGKLYVGGKGNDVVVVVMVVIFTELQLEKSRAAREYEKKIRCNAM
jgi:hypothetical protein